MAATKCLLSAARQRYDEVAADLRVVHKPGSLAEVHARCTADGCLAALATAVAAVVGSSPRSQRLAAGECLVSGCLSGDRALAWLLVAVGKTHPQFVAGACLRATPRLATATTRPVVSLLAHYSPAAVGRAIAGWIAGAVAPPSTAASISAAAANGKRRRDEPRVAATAEAAADATREAIALVEDCPALIGHIFAATATHHALALALGAGHGNGHRVDTHPMPAAAEGVASAVAASLVGNARHLTGCAARVVSSSVQLAAQCGTHGRALGCALWVAMGGSGGPYKDGIASAAATLPTPFPAVPPTHAHEFLDSFARQCPEHADTIVSALARDGVAADAPATVGERGLWLAWLGAAARSPVRLPHMAAACASLVAAAIVRDERSAGTSDGRDGGAASNVTAAVCAVHAVLAAAPVPCEPSICGCQPGGVADTAGHCTRRVCEYLVACLLVDHLAPAQARGDVGRATRLADALAGLAGPAGGAPTACPAWAVDVVGDVPRGGADVVAAVPASGGDGGARHPSNGSLLVGRLCARAVLQHWPRMVSFCAVPKHSLKQPCDCEGGDSLGAGCGRRWQLHVAVFRCLQCVESGDDCAIGSEGSTPLSRLQALLLWFGDALFGGLPLCVYLLWWCAVYARPHPSIGVQRLECRCAMPCCWGRAARVPAGDRRGGGDCASRPSPCPVRMCPCPTSRHSRAAQPLRVGQARSGHVGGVPGRW